MHTNHHQPIFNTCFSCSASRSPSHSPTLRLQNGCSHGGVLQNASDPITDMHFFGCHLQSNRKEPQLQVSFRLLPSFQKAPGAAKDDQWQCSTVEEILDSTCLHAFEKCLSKQFWYAWKMNWWVGMHCQKNTEDSRGRNQNAKFEHVSKC